MASSYILPQVVINQLFSEVTLNTIRNQNCLVFGPNYQLFRYSDKNMHDTLLLGRYNGAGVVVGDGDVTKSFEYPGVRPADSKVDESYVKLYGENVVVSLTTVNGFTKLDDKTSGSDLDGRIKFDVSIAGANRDAAFKRDIAVGDMVRIKTNEGDDTYFESQILEVFASAPGQFDCVRLADTLPESIVLDDSAETFDGEVEFCAVINSVPIERRSPAAESTAIYQWTAGEDEFTIIDGMVVMYDSWDDEPKQIVSADLYLEYRALLRGAADAIHSIERSSEVELMLGEIDVDNPLAYAVQKCTMNSADRVVYYMATDGEDKLAYTKVLETASKTEDVYFLVPLTQDKDILDLVASHVEEMSKGTMKRWRVAFVNADVPEVNTLYTPASSVDGKGFFAVIEAAKSGPYQGKNVILRFVSGQGASSDSPSTATKCMSQVVVGDTVVMYPGTQDIWGDEVTNRYKVAKVLSNSVLQLVDDEDNPIPAVAAGMRTEVEHTYTYAEITEAIAATSRNFASRRVYNTFPNYAAYDGVTFNGVHLAAAAAGVASSVLPQQPITNLEIRGVDDIPIVYETFSATQLNEIAAGGTFIIMQDLPGDEVYIRHQLSTARSEGNLLTSELSITKNLDSISYYFAEAYKPYIGKYNITPGLIEALRCVALDGLTMLETETAAGLYGPQVLEEGTEISQLYQDPVRQDHVYMHLKLNLPRPFNNLDLDLEVI